MPPAAAGTRALLHRIYRQPQYMPSSMWPRFPFSLVCFGLLLLMYREYRGHGTLGGKLVGSHGRTCPDRHHISRPRPPTPAPSSKSAPPPSSSPPYDETTNIISVCTMVRNSCSQLYAWIEWHRFMGVDKFLVYDIDTQDCSRDVLRRFVESGVVEIIQWPPAEYTTPPAHNMSICPEVQGFDAHGMLRFKMWLHDEPDVCRGALPEMHRLCAGQVQLTNAGQFTMRSSENVSSYKHRAPYLWDFCQYPQIADCFARHRHHRGFLGIYDVDEYMFSTDRRDVSLHDALKRVPLDDHHDMLAVEGLIYGNSDHFAPLQAAEFPPHVYRRHARQGHGPNGARTARDIQHLNSKGRGGSSRVPARFYALKSFYRLPHVFHQHRGVVPIEVHTSRKLPGTSWLKGLLPKKFITMGFGERGVPDAHVVLVPRDSGVIGYNHYMYRAMEELALAGLLVQTTEGQPATKTPKSVNPAVLRVFNAVSGTRMEHLLPGFLEFWGECAVPAVHARLRAYSARKASAVAPARRQASSQEITRMLRSTSFLSEPIWRASKGHVKRQKKMAEAQARRV